MNPTPHAYPRYVHTKKPLTPEDAEQIRQDRIASARAYVLALKEELRQAKLDLKQQKREPAPTHLTVQTKLLPEDEGYEDAPVGLDVRQYMGDWSWVDRSSKEAASE